MSSIHPQSKFAEPIETQFKHYRHLTVPFLNYYRRLFRGAELEDIASDADFGLFMAIRQYDSEREVKFETYARHKIRKAIQEGFRDRDKLSRRARQKGLTASVVGIDTLNADMESSLQYTQKELEAIDNADAVAVIFAQLDEMSARLLRMRFYEECDIPTIAGRMNLHPRNVYRQLKKILEYLAYHFQNHEYPTGQCD